MNYTLNKEVYKEQLEFIKTFCEKFGDTLNFYGLNINEYIRDFEGYGNATRLLYKFIDDGKLTNWVNDELKNKRVQSVAQIDIFYFMDSYDINTYVKSKGGTVEESFFTVEELMKLDSFHGSYCFENSLVDFHESHDDNDNGDTIFKYNDSRRFM